MQRVQPEVPQVACFDTAFHRTQAPVAQLYALPRDLSAAGIRRYGFHGLSYEYIASILPGVAGNAGRGRVVVAHLGNGSSMCAMRTERAWRRPWASPRSRGSPWAPGPAPSIPASSSTC